MAELSASGQFIHSLTGRGYNYAQIGRATGVNRSLIRQIANGDKPGRNLTETLRALDASGAPAPKRGKSIQDVTLPETPRKTLRSGQRPSVRQKELVVDEAKHGTQVERKTAKAGVNAIRKAAAKGQNVKLTLKFKEVEDYHGSEENAEVDLFEKGGMNAQKVLDFLDGYDGSDAAKLTALAMWVLGEDTVCRGFQGITVARFDVRRRD